MTPFSAPLRQASWIKRNALAECANLILRLATMFVRRHFPTSPRAPGRSPHLLANLKLLKHNGNLRNYFADWLLQPLNKHFLRRPHVSCRIHLKVRLPPSRSARLARNRTHLGPKKLLDYEAKRRNPARRYPFILAIHSPGGRPEPAEVPAPSQEAGTRRESRRQVSGS